MMHLEELNKFEKMTKREMKNLVGGGLVCMYIGISDTSYDEVTYDYYYDSDGNLRRRRCTYTELSYPKDYDGKRLGRGEEVIKEC